MRDADRSPFTITTPQGRTLHGEVDRPTDEDRRPVVIIAHGFKGFMEWGFFPYLAELLASRGFAVIRYNNSGAGMRPGDELVSDEEAFAKATFSNDVDDLLAIVAAVPEILEEHGRADRIGLFGHSRGGGATIVAAGEMNPPPRAMVTWASIATFDRVSKADKDTWRRQGWLPVVNSRTKQELRIDRFVLEDLEANRERLDVLAAAGRLHTPWLIVHGDDDTSVPVHDARELAGAGPNAEKLELDGAGHTFDARHPFQGPTPDLIQAMNATQSWFVRYLGV